MKTIHPACFAAIGSVSTFIPIAAAGVEAPDDAAIQPYAGNPWYWQYRGRPVVLVGGSHRDNLFQWAGQAMLDHIDLMHSLGGNYVRCTLSDRNPGDVYAFKQIGENLYDLNQWNPEYWNRLQTFLAETHLRGIIVQLTLWDQFDLEAGNWLKNPWGPAQNINYGTDLINSREDFYATVATDNTVMLAYQKRFIDHVLRHTLAYDHILYNINNESREGPVWENFWANYLRSVATAHGKRIYITSMQFDPSNAVRHVMTHAGLYDFLEVSQNNQDSRGGRGHAHWDNLMILRAKVAQMAGGPRPMNNEKVYGGGDGYRNYSSGTSREAEDRFWRNIIAGCASSRFHRDVVDWGIGLTERAQLNLRAMSRFLEAVDITRSAPHNDLISVRGANRAQMEAYVTARIGHHYAVYFPAGRFTVDLDPWIYVDSLRLRWLNIETAEWSEPETVSVEWEGGHDDWGFRGRVRLETPSNRAALALLEVVD